MDKKTLTEEDIKLRFITPSITNAGWTNKLIRMEYYFTDGRVIFQGNVHARQKGKKAAYKACSTGQQPEPYRCRTGKQRSNTHKPRGQQHKTCR